MTTLAPLLFALILAPLPRAKANTDRLNAARRKLEIMTTYFGSKMSETTRHAGFLRSSSRVGNLTLAVEWARQSTDFRLKAYAERCASLTQVAVAEALKNSDRVDRAEARARLICDRLWARARAGVEAWPTRLESGLRDRLFALESEFAWAHALTLPEVHLLTALGPERLAGALIDESDEALLPPRRLLTDDIVEKYLIALTGVLPLEAPGFAASWMSSSPRVDQQLGFSYDRLDWSNHLPWFSFFDRPLYTRDEEHRSILSDVSVTDMHAPYVSALIKLRRARQRAARYRGTRLGDRIIRTLTAYEALIANDFVHLNERHANMVDHWSKSPGLIVPDPAPEPVPDETWSTIVRDLGERHDLTEVFEVGHTAACEKYFDL